MNKVFKWNNAKFKFSAMDADMMEKFAKTKNKAMEELLAYEEKHGNNGLIDAEGVREECKILDKMFDLIFGDGAAGKMFSDTDLHERVAALNKLTKLRNSQIESYNKLVQAMSDGE